MVWPATFSLARAYLDQLERSKGLAAGEIAATRDALAKAEKASETERGAQLTPVAARLETQAGESAKVRTLSDVVKQLAAGSGVARGQ